MRCFNLLTFMSLVLVLALSTSCDKGSKANNLKQKKDSKPVAVKAAVKKPEIKSDTKVNKIPVKLMINDILDVGFVNNLMRIKGLVFSSSQGVEIFEFTNVKPGHKLSSYVFGLKLKDVDLDENGNEVENGEKVYLHAQCMDNLAKKCEYVAIDGALYSDEGKLLNQIVSVYRAKTNDLGLNTFVVVDTWEFPKSEHVVHWENVFGFVQSVFMPLDQKSSENHGDHHADMQKQKR